MSWKESKTSSILRPLTDRRRCRQRLLASQTLTSSYGSETLSQIHEQPSTNSSYVDSFFRFFLSFFLSFFFSSHFVAHLSPVPRRATRKAYLPRIASNLVASLRDRKRQRPPDKTCKTSVEHWAVPQASSRKLVRDCLVSARWWT